MKRFNSTLYIVWDLVRNGFCTRIKLVLVGKINRFPLEFWSHPDAVDNAVEILHYLFESVLQWSFEDIKSYYSIDLFTKYRLIGLFEIVFNGSPFQAINAAYPNRFKEWELPYVPKNFWNKETAIQAVKWLIEEKLKWNDHQVKKNLRLQTFYDHGLSRIIDKFFNSSPYKALNAVYPGRFHESDFTRGRRIGLND